MASAAPLPVMVQGPPMMEVKNIFFKAHPVINYFADEAEADEVDNEIAFQHFNRSLECSNKHGCVLLTFNNAFYLLRVSDILLLPNHPSAGQSTFKDVKKMEIRNDALPIAPNIISLSNGDEFLAVDTVRGDSAWVVIFKFADFINQGGSCRPFCEIRCSAAANSRINSICWNPGDGFGNLLALNTEDGSLFLAKLIAPNNVELNRFADGGVRCCCWSPKGKQLVIGRMNGNLSQLRLDLTEAKHIPAPEPNITPVSILWTQTTQFLIVFHKDSYIDFMQLDVPKGAPPVYTNSGDIFISESVPPKCNCFLVPLMQWNVVLGMSNSSSDVVVLVKQQQNSNDVWVAGDITDNRRAAFLLDHLAKGSCVYYGSPNQVTFSEVESYSPMPMVFLLSQRGSLLVYSIVNSDPQAASLNVNVSTPIPDAAFSSIRTPAPAAAPQPVPSVPQANPSAPFFQVPPPPQQQQQKSSPSPFQTTNLFQSQPQVLPNLPQPVSLPPTSKPTLFSAPSLPVDQAQAPQKTKAVFGMPQTVDPRQLGTSTLPTAQDMAGLQKAVEEKRREMTTQLQKGASLKGLEEDDQCAFVISEVRKFEQRLADFTSIVESNRGNLTKLVNISFDDLEKRVLSTLNVVEDFSSDMVSTTSAQKEEVDVLKERILNHFSQLEYAKSLVERSRDPRYLEHLRSRPMDPTSQQKFEEIRKLHNYLTNQVAECRRYFYEQTRKRDMPLDRVSYTQLIYLTLSNHSKIIRRLKSELDSIKERLGLGRHNSSYEDTEYLAVCEASYSGAKKLNSNDDPDEITLNDLTAGISKVKLNRDSDRPDKKPIKLANRKLYILKKCMPEVTVIKVKADEASWTRSPAKTAPRPKPMTYPTASTDGAKPRALDPKPEPSVQVKPVLPSFTIKTESPSQPQRLSSTPSAPFTGVSVPSPGIDLSSLIKASLSEASGTTSPNRPTASPTVNTPPKFAANPAIPSLQSLQGEISFASKPSANPSSILKTPVQVPSGNNNSTPPSTQLPTLAGLLATPVPTVSSNLFSSSGLSFTNPSAGITVKQEKGLSFGPGSFSFGTQPIGVAPTKVSSSSNLPPNIGTSTPASLSISFGTSAPSSVSVPASSISTFTSPSVTSTASAPAPNISSLTISSVTPSIVSAPAPNVSALTTSSVTPSTVSAPVPTISTLTISSVTPSTVSTPAPNVSALTTSSVTPSTVSAPPSSTSTFTSSSGTSIFGGGGFLSKASPISAVSTGPSIGSGAITTTTPKPSSGVGFGSPTAAASVFGGSATFGSSTPFGSSFASNPPITSLQGEVSLASNLKPTESPSSILKPPVEVSSGNNNSATQSAQLPTLAGLLATPVSTVPSNLFSPSGLSFTNPSAGVTVKQEKGLSSFGPGSFSFTQPIGGAPTTVSTSSNLPPNIGTSTPSSLSISFGTSAPSTVSAPASSISTFTSSSATSIFGGGGFLNKASPISTASTVPSLSGGAITTTTPKPSTGFGSPSAAAPVFGGGATFGSSSPFGSSFAQSPSSTFGSTGGSVFGGGGAVGVGNAGFGALAQQGTASPGFGSTAKPGFGSQPTPASVFGGAATFGSSSTFGSSFAPSPNSTSTFGPAAGSVFGGGGSVGNAGFGTLAQQGTTSPGFGGTATSGFGSPPAAAPVFGGGATFGSSSPFGSSFAQSPNSTFGSTGGSVFGGGGTVGNAGFGALAQQGTTSPGFGSTGTPGFGATQPQQQQQQQPSLFGSPQQQSKPVFGGQAFSSWR